MKNKINPLFDELKYKLTFFPWKKNWIFRRVYLWISTLGKQKNWIFFPRMTNWIFPLEDKLNFSKGTTIFEYFLSLRSKSNYWNQQITDPDSYLRMFKSGWFWIKGNIGKKWKIGSSLHLKEVIKQFTKICTRNVD